MNNHHYLQGDWTPCYCAPELYNKSSILRNINNWNTKTAYIDTITFSITFQVKIHQIQIYSKQKLSKSDLISYYTNTWFSAKPISSAFIIIAIEEEIISLIILNWSVDFLLLCTRIHNKSSILRNIDNWNINTTDITPLHSASQFKSKYIKH